MKLLPLLTPMAALLAWSSAGHAEEVAPGSFWAQIYAEQDEKDRSFQTAIPEAYANKPEVSVQLERLPNGSVSCHMVNNTQASVFVPGYNLRSPLYKVEILVNGVWTDSGLLHMCAPLRPTPELLAGKACQFPLSLRQMKSPVRVGIPIRKVRQSGEQTIIWSDAIAPPAP